MEESTNGKIEETQIVETGREEEGEKIAFKNGEVSLAKEEIVTLGNHGATEVEETEIVKGNAPPTVVDASGFAEEVKEVVDAVGIVVPLPGEANVKLEDSDMNVQVDGEISEDKTVSAPREIGEVVFDLDALNGEKEEAPIQLPHSADKIEGDVHEEEKNVSEDIKIESFAINKDGLSQLAGDDVVVNEVEEEILSTMDEKVVVHSASTEVMPRGLEEANLEEAAIEESYGEPPAVVEKETVGNVHGLSPTPPVSSNVIGSSDGNPETTGDPPIISLGQRSVPPTSWKSCCGIFDVLRRSDR